MTENQPGHREPSKLYRRRKKHEGATWSIDSKSALDQDGVWCKHHGRRHGYKSSQLGFTPERWNGRSYVHWYCKATGEVLDTQELNHANGNSGTDPTTSSHVRNHVDAGE